MDDRINIIDKLTAISIDLNGISQLLMMIYENARRDGVDAEHLVVLHDVTRHCYEELDALKQKI